MKHRELGKSGLEVSALGMGCMGLNFAYGPGVDEQSGVGAIQSPGAGLSHRQDG
jgi:pyridoxine 4-dehydrogenase